MRAYGGVTCANCGAPIDHKGAWIGPTDEAAPDDDQADDGAVDDATLADIAAAEPSVDETFGDENCPFAHAGFTPQEHAKAHELLKQNPKWGPNDAHISINRDREVAGLGAADLERRGATASRSQQQFAELVDRRARRHMSEAGLSYPAAARRAFSELSAADRRRYERGR
jgi:hypothetical protein